MMMQPHTSYLICATPRCGSTLLCEALINTGLAGQPKEYFEHLRQTGQPRRPQEYFLADSAIACQLGDYSRLDDEAKLSECYLGSAYSAYLAQVIEEGTTPNGVFGAKVMWGYLDDFISNLRGIPGYQELPAPDLLSTIFPNLCYIWATRRNKVRQAVSLWRAIQTWTWKQEETDGAHLVAQELLFNFAAIDHLVQQIEAHEAEWQNYFATHDIQPFIVVYEELTEAYEQTALDILYYLRIPLYERLTFNGRRLKQQSDDISEEWVQRYNSLKATKV
ncbi:MAG: Stf0 family sulfotransferase [Ktedonobacteraceae bacterium]|jgi:trehalose 2-sulfotransferase